MNQPAHTSYKDKENIDFELILDKNYNRNLNSLHLGFPIRFRKLSNATQDLDLNLLAVNNFLPHWIKEIDVIKYGTNNNYSQQLPHKKYIGILTQYDRRSHNNDDTTKRNDGDIEDREERFVVPSESKYVYRISPKYFCNLGKINFQQKFH